MLRYILLAALVAATLASNSYVVLAPTKLRPGMDYSVSVNILQATGDVSVTASIVRANDNSDVATATATITQGNPGTIDLQIPEDLRSGTYELHVSGTGGLTFQNETHITYTAKAMSIYVQTDKAMYKPGQKVNFRALGVYPDLQVYTGQMNVEIFDPNTNKIKQWIGVTGDSKGVFEQALPLSTQPVQGDWKIKVTVGGSTKEKTFTVAEYVLPKFEVTVELPSYALESQASVPVTVTAKYTYGEPVAGPVLVEAEVTNYYTTVAAIQQSATLDSEGRAQLTFPMTQLLSHYNNHLNGRTMKFTANVTESLTGIVRSGESSVDFFSHAVKVEFLSSNPTTFKPGLEYVGYVKVSQPDGLPVQTSNNHKLTLDTTATAEIHEATTPYAYYMPRTMNYHLSPQTLNLPDNGLVEFRLTVPDNATSLNVHATFDGVSVYNTVSKSYSPSDNYIQLFLRSTGRLQAGHQMQFEAKATEPLNEIVYQVLSRGSIVAAGSANAHGSQTFHFAVDIDSSMAPNARIVVYYVRADGEVVTDSISFDVEGAFQNQVSISMSLAEAQPADSVDVTVTASPNSEAYLLAVDQSVLLLKSGNDITAPMVIDELKTFDTITNNAHPIDIMPLGGAIGRRKRMIWWPYPVYYGGSDANQIFTNAGVVVLTDAMVYHYVQPHSTEDWFAFAGGCGRKRCAAFFPGVNGLMPGMPPEAPATSTQSEQLQEVEHTRSVFPETWLWTNATTGADGTATISTTVPDTITSWVASAFAVSSSDGLGVAPDTAKLKVFRPFFVSLNLPYSVVRGEQVVLQAIVFNYMSTDQDVRVTLAQSQDFFNLVVNNGQEDLRHEDTAITVHVPAGEGKSVYFPIVPANLGNVELVVSAQSTQAADAVRRNLLVEAEGVPKEYSVNVLVDLKDTSSFTKDITLTLPPNVVADSERAVVTAIGDLMGPTVSGLDRLLRMPTGCGEQTMIGLAPDVFVSSYLKATNQLSSDIAEKALSFMEHGYQRELTYQHKDGSFSAFGDRDSSGSMWLTAFVVKTFHQAKPYIFIDDQVINRAIEWMLNKQSADGSFAEPGVIHHKDMQGGSGTGPGLTAFVLIALLENNDIQGSLSTRVTDAQNKAIAYLKQELPNINNDYILSIITYALSLANDPEAANAFSLLESHATTDGGMKHWHIGSTTQTSTTNRWHRPAGAGARDVEMTSYALLTYAADNNFVGGLSVMKWVASQRNPNGGYSSTQDTILALQALSEFARLAYSNNFNIEADVTASGFSKHFSIGQANALVLQMAEMPSIPQTVHVAATGSGIALVEVHVYFNVEAEVEEPTFEITTRLLKDTINLIQIETCAKWLSTGSSGMAVAEVGVPSGFEVDLESMQSPNTLKRTETENRKVILYFDDITPTPACVTMDIVRTGLVAKSQPVAVRVYDYYDPDNQATAFYESAVLKDSSVCDVCADCCAAPGGK